MAMSTPGYGSAMTCSSSAIPPRPAPRGRGLSSRGRTGARGCRSPCSARASRPARGVRSSCAWTARCWPAATRGCRGRVHGPDHRARPQEPRRRPHAHCHRPRAAGHHGPRQPAHPAHRPARHLHGRHRRLAAGDRARNRVHLRDPGRFGTGWDDVCMARTASRRRSGSSNKSISEAMLPLGNDKHFYPLRLTSNGLDPFPDDWGRIAVHLSAGAGVGAGATGPGCG